MSRPPRPTIGSSLKVKERSIPFSFWPVGKTTRRYGLQSHLFITNPWTIIRRSIQTFTPEKSRTAALSYLDQAEDFFRAAASGTTAAAKPLLFYYSLMNLVKAFCLHKGVRDDYSKLVSIFAVFYYFGSITRYRPYQFQAISDGDFGSQIQEVLTNLPNQFLYLIASEFAEQEVTKAAIV
jgi:YaaC-like Protein